MSEISNIEKNHTELNISNSNAKTDSNSTDATKTDVIIIGAGPVGIFASFACGMLGLKSHIIETRSQPGGQCSSLYADKSIYDIPALNDCTAGEMIDRLVTQANMFSPQWSFGETVTSLDEQADSEGKNSVVAITNKNQSIQAKAVIIAAGMGACIPNRLVFENAHLYENHQLFYHIDNPEMFKDKEVVILGGGNSAADWTLHLCKIAKKVTLIHRRSAFTAFKSSIDQFEHYIRSGKLRICNETTVSRLSGNDSNIRPKLYGLDTKNKAGQEETIDCDYILACYGLKNDISVIKDFGVGFGIEVNTDKISVDPNTGRTNRNRIYAVGDIAAFPNKRKLFSILSGFQECTIAAYDIFESYGDKSSHNPNQHSTSLFD